MPDVMTQPTLEIIVEDGNMTVDNPLYQYTFHSFPLNETEFPSDPTSGDYWLANYSSTVRGVNKMGDPSDFSISNSYLDMSGLMQSTVRRLGSSLEEVC